MTRGGKIPSTPKIFAVLAEIRAALRKTGVSPENIKGDWITSQDQIKCGNKQVTGPGQEAEFLVLIGSLRFQKLSDSSCKNKGLEHTEI